MSETLILAIESSCDETASAVLCGQREVLSDVVASQVDLHAEYGGVVPELACRAHVESIDPVVKEALAKAGVTLNDITAIAATQGPGLVGALLVGLSYAKALAWSTGLPLVPVNHLEAHISAAFVEDPAPGDNERPFVGLVVSGGHTSLYLCEERSKYKLLGQTLDDAAGEAFDKVAKIMGLGYPGGVVIDQLAKEGNRESFEFPRPMMKKSRYDFSFSGLKTALRTHVERYPEGLSGEELKDTCASFQEAVVEVLVVKAMRAVKDSGVRDMVVCGGVACNSRLREMMAEACEKRGIKLVIPRPRYCTDNAVMVAAAGLHRFEAGVRGTMDIQAVPTWPLEGLGGE